MRQTDARSLLAVDSESSLYCTVHLYHAKAVTGLFSDNS